MILLRLYHIIQLLTLNTIIFVLEQQDLVSHTVHFINFVSVIHFIQLSMVTADQEHKRFLTSNAIFLSAFNVKPFILNKIDGMVKYINLGLP